MREYVEHSQQSKIFVKVQLHCNWPDYRIHVRVHVCITVVQICSEMWLCFYDTGFLPVHSAVWPRSQALFGGGEKSLVHTVCACV